MILYGASFYLCQCLLVQAMFQMWGTGLLLPAVWGESHKIAMLFGLLQPFIPFPPLFPHPLLLTDQLPSLPIAGSCKHSITSCMQSQHAVFSHPRVLSPAAWRWRPHHSAGCSGGILPSASPLSGFPPGQSVTVPLRGPIWALLHLCVSISSSDHLSFSYNRLDLKSYTPTASEYKSNGLGS